MTPENSAALRRRLVEQLVNEDLLHDPDVLRAARTVPRETFLGSAVYVPSDPPGVTVWTPTLRADVPAEEWMRLTYRNATWVTQLDGVLAEDATGPVTGGTPTSSSTLPGLILWMIEQARLAAGTRVLIIGAGTELSTAYTTDSSRTRQREAAACGFPDSAARRYSALMRWASSSWSSRMTMRQASSIFVPRSTSSRARAAMRSW